MALDVVKQAVGDLWQVELSGRLDAVEAPGLEEELADIPAGIKKIELEFSDVEYIASAGLRALLMVKKLAAKQDIKIIIKNPQQEVMDVFDVTGFTNFFEIVQGHKQDELTGPTDGFYPLRPIQRWLVDTHFRKANSTMMNIGALLKLDEAVDLERLAEAVNDVLQTYDIFRCRLVFHPDTGEVCQRFDGSVSKVRVEILSEMAFEERKRELEKPFKLIDRPLYRIYLMLTPSGKYIYGDFYHAIMDGTAVILLFWREVNKHYMRKTAKRQPASYAEYVWEEAQELQSGQEEGHRYWQEMLAGFDPQKHLPPTDVSREDSWHEGAVDCDLNNINHKFFADRPYSENTFFIAAAMAAMAKVTGNKEVIMSWVHNARTSIKEMRLMGLLLNQYPLKWDFGQDMSITQFLTALEEKINKGITYAKGLDMVYKDDLEGECASFILQKDTDIKASYILGGLPCQVEEMPPNKRSAAENVLDIAVTVLDDGHYSLRLAYDASRYSEEAMHRYAAAYDEMLSAMQADERKLAEILP